LSERARVRRHCGPLWFTLYAVKSGSICFAVVSISGGVIVLSERFDSQTVNIQRANAANLVVSISGGVRDEKKGEVWEVGVKGALCD